MDNDETKRKLMEIALKEAKKSYLKDEVPVGCVITRDNKVISKAHNLVQSKKNITAHSEIIALNKAMKKLGIKYLDDCELYVSLEPCSMCAGAIVLSKIKKVYIATEDVKTGAAGGVFNILNNSKLNHQCEIEFGILKEESSKLLKDFFRELRVKKKNPI